MPPLQPPGDRETLRRLLAENAFVHAADGHDLRSRSGTRLPWLYYGGRVSLTARGARLMAGAVLERLAGFEATQLATYGISAVPLLATCLALGGERHTGLVVRKEPKEHGFARRIDGPVDPGRPVVLVDDSVSSGNTLRRAVHLLEAEGLRVEGAVCLVEFSGYGAREWFTARGYRLETVYDVWRDLDRPGTAGSGGAAEPAAVAPWSTDRLPSGVPPAEAARLVADHLVRTGLLLRPPGTLDRLPDAAGGTFVSVRRRADDVRLARAGFRRDGEGADAPADLVLATGQAVRSAGLTTPAELDAVKFAVSFLSGATPVGPGRIDHRRHALVVRGLGPLDRTGFALPNSPHYDDAIEQYHYARTFSGRFWRLEPHELYQQSVERVCEAGQQWPPYGAPPPAPGRTGSPELHPALARQLAAALAGRPAPPGDEALDLSEVGGTVHGVGVSLYADGLVGCSLSLTGDPLRDLRRAATGALADERYRAAARPARPEDLTAVVSLLTHRRLLGRIGPERLPLFHRLGRDTLQARAGDRQGLVLAHFAVHQSIDQAAYVGQVLRKAGLTARDDPSWTAYETVSWAVTGGRARRLDLGHPVRPGPPDGARRRALVTGTAEYVLGQCAADGLPAYHWEPWTGVATTAGTGTRVLIALTGLFEAAAALGGEQGEALGARALAMLDRFVDGTEVRAPRGGDLSWSGGADAQLLSCLVLAGRQDRHTGLALRLVRRLRRLFREDGAVHEGAVRMSADLDLLSGSVLLALARADSWCPEALAGLDLDRVLAFHRRRFRLARPWGMVWWHGQAWHALAGRAGHLASGAEGAGFAGFAGFADELVDWALERQTEDSGAFVIHDLEPPRTSFLTACVLEAVADAWVRAAAAGDVERAARRRVAWERGAAFLDRLTVRRGEAYFSPRPEAAVGGVRATLPSSDLRIDVAGHALIALAKGLRAGGGGPGGATG